METMLKLVLGFSALTSLFLTSSAQNCNNYTFNSSRVFSNCRDLPYLNSHLHWTFNQSTGQLDVAYRHDGINSTNRWVAWALNPAGSLASAMPGAQALVAILQNGTVRAYTSPISGYSTALQPGNLSFPVSGLTATYLNSEVIMFATLSLNRNVSSMVHAWQEGSVSGSTPQAHAMNSVNVNAKETLNLV
ncbi:cytochrome b561 and DOMON domain-containing protein At4g17280-like [Prosopis cineraria]|uniref:cytochrome b561 and DOMON domain-containing protein At4g17280-like n=1 Tax=Prosopis cineraria TaxID=364024 RepID=UPI00240EC7F7|nr:cytochrome b561 and DOMON domain-containing protein At4g17280-like [Prosopis cineraria]